MLSHLKEYLSSVVLFMQILTPPSGGRSYYDAFCRGGGEAQRGFLDKLINCKKTPAQLQGSLWWPPRSVCAVVGSLISSVCGSPTPAQSQAHRRPEKTARLYLWMSASGVCAIVYASEFPKTTGCAQWQNTSLFTANYFFNKWCISLYILIKQKLFIAAN